jgi:ATP-dependent helicase HrpA
VAGGDFPRSPEAFAKLNETARGRWHESAAKIGVALDGIVEAVREVREWISAHAKDRNHGEIAADLEEELLWLFRAKWAWRAGYERLIDYPRRLRAIRSRLGRVKSLPLVKDLEKMDLVRHHWQGWFTEWMAAPEDARLWEAGWLLEEWRVQSFAPDVEVKGKVSEKRVAAALEKRL